MFLVPDVDARGNTVTHGCESTILSCTGGACSRGYKRGERGRKAPRSLLEEEMIEANANIGAQESGCVCSASYVCVNDDEIVEKMVPGSPFIDTRRGGVHIRGDLKSSSSPRIGGAQWVTTIESTLWGTEEHGAGCGGCPG